MASRGRPFGASDSESDDSQAATDAQLAKEEANIDREMHRLEEKKKLVQAKRDVHYREFVAATKVDKCNTPGSGGSSNDNGENAVKRKAAVHNLRESFTKRTTLGTALDWPEASPRKPSPICAPAPNEKLKPAPTVKGYKHCNIRLDADKVFEAASVSLAKMVNDIMICDGVKVPEHEQRMSGAFRFRGEMPPFRVPDSLPHRATRRPPT